jgi:hypothetical protein
MHHRSAEQKAYYRREATECAVAASATSVAEVKQAYSTLNKVGCPSRPKATNVRQYGRNWYSPWRRVTSRSIGSCLGGEVVNQKNLSCQPLELCFDRRQVISRPGAHTHAQQRQVGD